MSFDIMAALVPALKDALGVPCSTAVPEKRPASFVTIERTGGAYSLGKDEPALAIQTWGMTEGAAYDLALMAREWLLECWQVIPEVCRVTVDGIVHFPDPDSRQERYQLNVYMVTRA